MGQSASDMYSESNRVPAILSDLDDLVWSMKEIITVKDVAEILHRHRVYTISSILDIQDEMMRRETEQRRKYEAFKHSDCESLCNFHYRLYGKYFAVVHRLNTLKTVSVHAFVD